MLKNMKIRTRMLFSYAVIIVLCLAASVAALVMMKRISSNLTSFYDNNYAVTVNVWTAKREMQFARADILKAMLETDENDMKISLDNASAALANMRAAFPNIRKRFKGDMTLMDEVDSTLAEAIVYRDQIFELTAAEKNEEAFALMNTSYIPLLNQMSDSLDKITLQAANNAKAMVDQGQQLQMTSRFIMIVIILLNIALAFLFGLYISNSIRKPVEEIRDAAKKLATGSLDVSIGYQSKDELGNLSDSIRSLIRTFQGIISDMNCRLASLGNGDFTVTSKAEEFYVGDFQQLAASVEQITIKLSRTMKQINQSSDQVSTGSDQVSSGAQDLARGATEQAASVEELAASINEISSQVRENARNSQYGSELAAAAGAKIEEANRQMQEMIASMHDISHKSGQIGKIIQTIEDIAFQTNILALNASVEAAHVSTAKGFAVIADEVRNLADKSARASTNTAALIEGTIQAVNLGTKIADETAYTLTEVVESARQMVSAVDKISKASNVQAAAIAQVTQGIDQISNVVQANSATAEESAAASEELYDQAQMLKNLVNQFKLRQ
ncbi:methyl-accepting chemotaxis protein [Clostridium sp. chh4-2]|uniref:methyl-accepting chemotaxis protein n=1 Tax=Clostridium sp. chh4-2 TaxID=2067550 RepID=UPI000CCF8827|nr:methyl-accepting chemotaxis protein [Clostridium sp. chh4-2]PNV63472.1 methyl-accepting chemotaxis protein [Clostridium sp. chh4-2]